MATVAAQNSCSIVHLLLLCSHMTFCMSAPAVLQATLGCGEGLLLVALQPWHCCRLWETCWVSHVGVCVDF
jgi:hypothetical protein